MLDLKELSHPPSRRTWRTPLGWSLVGLGAACIVGGSVLAWQADGKATEYANAITRRGDLERERETYLYSGIGLFGVSAALLGSGVHLLATEGRQAEERRDPKPGSGP